MISRTASYRGRVMDYSDSFNSMPICFQPASPSRKLSHEQFHIVATMRSLGERLNLLRKVCPLDTISPPNVFSCSELTFDFTEGKKRKIRYHHHLYSHSFSHIHLLQLINLRCGPGAAVLPPEVSRIHMDFALKTKGGHMGARFAQHTKSSRR